jgi:hypothetical protein
MQISMLDAASEVTCPDFIDPVSQTLQRPIHLPHRTRGTGIRIRRNVGTD